VNRGTQRDAPLGFSEGRRAACSSENWPSAPGTPGVRLRSWPKTLSNFVRPQRVLFWSSAIPLRAFRVRLTVRWSRLDLKKLKRGDARLAVTKEILGFQGNGRDHTFILPVEKLGPIEKETIAWWANWSMRQESRLPRKPS
jgi:hypothetical protein